MPKTALSFLLAGLLAALPIAAYADCAEGGYYSSENFEGDVYLVAGDGQGNGLYAGTVDSTSGFGGPADIILSVNCYTNESIGYSSPMPLEEK